MAAGGDHCERGACSKRGVGVFCSFCSPARACDSGSLGFGLHLVICRDLCLSRSSEIADLFPALGLGRCRRETARTTTEPYVDVLVIGVESLALSYGFEDPQIGGRICSAP